MESVTPLYIFRCIVLISSAKRYVYCLTSLKELKGLKKQHTWHHNFTFPGQQRKIQSIKKLLTMASAKGMQFVCALPQGKTKANNPIMLQINLSRLLLRQTNRPCEFRQQT